MCVGEWCVKVSNVCVSGETKEGTEGSGVGVDMTASLQLWSHKHWGVKTYAITNFFFCNSFCYPYRFFSHSSHHGLFCIISCNKPN